MPLNVRDITNKALEYGLLDFSNGKTPNQTMKAKLSVDIKRLGTRSRFKRSDRGLFTLREFQIREYTSRPFKKTIPSSEDVMVFPSKLLSAVGWFHGVRQDWQTYADVLLNRENTIFMPRVEAETSVKYKQPVSYVLIKKHDAILRFVRGSYSSVQSFLKGRLCIGFGGHVQSKDFDNMPLLAQIDSGYRQSILREINEELYLPRGAITDRSLRTIGVLNDDSSFVGKAHFAFIHLLNLDYLGTQLNPKLLKKEKSINQLRFVPIGALGEEFESYEYWSKLCIETFFGDLVQIRTKIRRVRNYSLRKHNRHIAIVGSIGSGKSEAARLLNNHFNYDMISSSSLLAQVAQLPPVAQIGRQRFQELGLAFIRSDRGAETLASAIVERIAALKRARVVIDGIRNLKTFEILKEKLSHDLSLIFVESTPDNAYEFYKAREDSSISFADFLELLHHPVEAEIPDLLALANIVIYNHADKTSYTETVSNFLRDEVAMGENQLTI